MKTAFTFSFASAAAAMSIITPAYAEAAPSDGGFASLIPLLLIMVIFYFLLIRPQQKKLKDHRSMVDSLSKGDKVMTGGGVYGKITAVKDDVLKVEIADGVVISVKRDTVAGLAETAPVKEKTDKE
ncbi:protein translocase subunit yajC [Mariprofundus ferrinatatus]|uniref:Sec translocon accessory complex subunit YajC n=1 Tax=Mariprofundus ferrinatatus TaxID=1921087 RepID=A0A2K8L329_9PROT|nr:preprotein translocase subunit YajC [Mariprofundus ferrinatatus]ATX81663.1 protein translocase subunit yajC [Mariprofundus ferrinatatus]